ncbi:IclR family transcriptional regulator [Microbacterium sp. RD1]|uniref:IclR family transcriptional regulator n=1 Tax=Microbacterium sp. RD1 TaxID=3457313 RepID=UPI003FA58376
MEHAPEGRIAAAMKVLELLSGTDRVTVRAAAEYANIGRSAAHRILAELERSGHVIRGEGGRGYFPGPAVVLRERLPIQSSSRHRIRPVLQDLHVRTEESVHAALLIGDHVLVLDGRPSCHRPDIGLRVGMTAPAHAMAAGKLLLATLPDRTVAALFPTDPLPRRSRFTVGTRVELLDALREVRRRGVARAEQESEPGVNSVAVPLDGQSWRTRMAMVVSVPVRRGAAARMDELERIARDVVRHHALTGRISPWSLRQR